MLSYNLKWLKRLGKAYDGAQFLYEKLVNIKQDFSCHYKKEICRHTDADFNLILY